MDSPDTEFRYSYDAAGQSGQNRRGPNPNRDYKRHFIRQKERYNTVTADQVNRKKELNRASAKQWKLQDEIEFIIDAIAGERHRRQQATISEDVPSAERLPTPVQVVPTSGNGERMAQSYTPSVGEGEEEDVKPIITAKQKEEASAKRDAVDEELEDLLGGEQDAAPAKTSRKSGGTVSSTKRQRSFSLSEDMDDELLESAGGFSASKRARNR